MGAWGEVLAIPVRGSVTGEGSPIGYGHPRFAAMRRSRSPIGPSLTNEHDRISPMSGLRALRSRHSSSRRAAATSIELLLPWA